MNLILRMLPFALVMTTVTVGIHYYLYVRLGRDPMWPEPWPQIIKWALVGVAASIPLTMMLGRLVPRDLANLFAWPVFIWMGLMFYLLIGNVASEPLRLLVKVVGVDTERRTLLMRGLALVIGGGAVGAVGLGVRHALSALHVREVTFTLPKWPKALDGFRIVQLTDIHVGPTIGREFIADMVRKTNALNPDLVALTGDLVDGSVAELGPSVAPLADLKSRFGAFFVTGNHEYYSGAEEWLQHVQTLGIRALRNEHVLIGEGAASFALAGVDDYDSTRFGHEPSVSKAVQDRDPSRATVLMAHQPRAFPEACENGVCLTLSGHTHAGQMWPWGHAVRLQTEYLVGSFKKGESHLYVSPGTGYWGPPVRVGTQAEITLITIKALA